MSPSLATVLSNEHAAVAAQIAPEFEVSMAKPARTEWTDKLQARAQNVVFHLAQGKEASLRKLDPVSRNLLRQRVPEDVLVHPAL